MHDLLYMGLTNAVVVAVLAVPAYCVSRWGKRPALAHLLWLFILIKLVTPPLWQVAVRLPISTAEAPSTTVDVQPPPQDFVPNIDNIVANQALSQLPGVDEQQLSPAPIIQAAEATSPPGPHGVETAIVPIAPTQTPAAFPWEQILAFCWLAGSGLVFGLAIWRMAAFARCLQRVQPARANVQELATDLSRHLGLRTTPDLGIAPIRMAPLVWGWGAKPRVVIPTDLWETLDPEQRSMLLVHEFAHLRRGDHWVRLLEILVRGAYWWHPVVWLAGREMREAEEQCCDAWAVWALPHAAKAYARALVDTVDFLSQRSVPLPAGASGIGQVQDLRRRLIMIMRGTTPRKLSATTLAGLVVLGGALLVMGLSFGQEQSSPDSIAAIDPFQNLGVPTQDTFREANQNEIERLRQQELNLRQAMEALSRSLDTTRKQLETVQGAPRSPSPREQISVPAALAPARQDEVRSVPPVARARNNPRDPADARPRRTQDREVSIEDRLTRLEQQMDQIARALEALQPRMAIPPSPRRPRSSIPPAVPVSPEPDLARPSAEPRPTANPARVIPDAPLPPVTEIPADSSVPLPSLAPAPPRPTSAPPAIPATGPRPPANRNNPPLDPRAEPEAPVSPAVPPDAVVPRASVAPPAVSPRSTSTPPSPAVTPKLVEDNVLKDAEVSAFLHEVDRTYKDLVQQKIIADGPDALPTYQEYAARVDDLRKKLNAEKERSVR
ncbi:MAG TPA: M56 family metallopeptidase [Gemmataceae bacterium]|nr:M56 family metallopeptidase [Gemmataceae bacterium]